MTVKMAKHGFAAFYWFDSVNTDFEKIIYAADFVMGKIVLRMLIVEKPIPMHSLKCCCSKKVKAKTLRHVSKLVCTI